MARKSRLSNLLSTLVLLAFLLGAAVLATRMEPSEPAVSGQARASDGDSLHLGAQRVRLLGIDAPELAQACQDAGGRDWPCGEAARAAMTAQLKRGVLTCAPEGRDRYDRLLAHCRIGGADLGETMVRQGWALSTDGYDQAEAEARRARRGIWQGRFEMPRDWRRAHQDGRDDPSATGPFDGLLRLLGS